MVSPSTTLDRQPIVLIICNKPLKIIPNPNPTSSLPYPQVCPGPCRWYVLRSKPVSSRTYPKTSCENSLSTYSRICIRWTRSSIWTLLPGSSLWPMSERCEASKPCSFNSCSRSLPLCWNFSSWHTFYTSGAGLSLPALLSLPLASICSSPYGSLRYTSEPCIYLFTHRMT